ncbi:MAG: glycosyltransferase family 4 protein [Limnothrix sp. RL_2_0]|nr:glycosyltransferase family 4 protein [Limnothrix sp. RL_2_0]
MPQKKILIFTPIFFGSGTGAATYYQLLVKSLQKYNFSFTIVSETNNQNNRTKSFKYISLLPLRSGKNKQFLKDLFLYAWQNLNYFRLFNIFSRAKYTSALMHSSFYNHLSFFDVIIRILIKTNSDVTFITDVRDVLLPQEQVKNLSVYKNVIACSKNIVENLLQGGLSQAKIIHIPIPQASIIINLDVGLRFQNDLDLKNERYIFYAGMIKELKAVDLLLEIFVNYVQPQDENIKLVLAGYLKTKNSEIIERLKAKNVVYLGNCSQEEVHCLTFHADLCVNLSPCESIARSSLEAIALHRPVLLPPNIPEYLEHCPELVATSRDPQVLAAQMMHILQTGITANYPIELHDPERIAKQYYELLS